MGQIKRHHISTNMTSLTNDFLINLCILLGILCTPMMNNAELIDAIEDVRRRLKCRAEICALECINYLRGDKFKFISHDKMIDGGRVVRYRPDLLLKHKYVNVMLVIEIDEGQHRSYPVEFEHTRMVEISTALGTPTLFIRFNPDKYTLGVTEINNSLEYRLLRLKYIIDEVGEIPAKDFSHTSVIKMFYDNADMLISTSIITLKQ